MASGGSSNGPAPCVEGGGGPVSIGIRGGQALRLATMNPPVVAGWAAPCVDDGVQGVSGRPAPQAYVAPDPVRSIG